MCYIEKGDQLEEKVFTLRKRLKNCTICPHYCQVNRLEGEKGICQAGEQMVISGYGPHFGEEKSLVGNRGSGTIFFSHCNLRCVFCQNYEISHGGQGHEISPIELAEIMISLQKTGCHNINFVSPSHFVPQILEGVTLAIQRGLTLPLIYNTGGYDDIGTLKLLDGVIDIYMPDIKFGNNENAKKYTNAAAYFDVVIGVVKEMYRQVGTLQLDSKGIAHKGLLIRHLLMPEDISASKKVLEFIATELSRDTALNIMTQYYPAYKAHNYPELSRRTNIKEYLDVMQYAKKLGLSNFV